MAVAASRGAAGRDNIARQCSIRSRIGSHAAAVPMIQSISAALFSTLASSNSTRAARQRPFGTPARAATDSSSGQDQNQMRRREQRGHRRRSLCYPRF